MNHTYRLYEPIDSSCYSVPGRHRLELIVCHNSVYSFGLVELVRLRRRIVIVINNEAGDFYRAQLPYKVGVEGA